MQNTAATETRTALLTATLADKAIFSAAYAADDMDLARRDARTLADRGVKVALRWTTENLESDIDVRISGAVATGLAKFARDERFNMDTIVGYRVLTNPMGEIVIWFMVRSETRDSRGYLLSWHRGMDRMELCSAAPSTGLYMWGWTRLRGVEPCEGAIIVHEWTVI